MVEKSCMQTCCLCFTARNVFFLTIYHYIMTIVNLLDQQYYIKLNVSLNMNGPSHKLIVKASGFFAYVWLVKLE